MRLIVSAFVMVAVIMGTFTLYASIAPSLAVSRAARNFGAEVTERVGTTPLQAFGMAANSLESGSVTVDFASYQTDRWGTTTTNFNFTVVSDAENHEYALYGEVYSNGEIIDFVAYINPERIAVGSSMIGDDLFGINFNTLAADIASLNDLLGLDYYDMAMVEDVIDSFVELMNQPPAETDAYAAALVGTLHAAERASDRITTLSDGSRIQARRVEYTITVEAMIDLLEEWLDILEGDEAVRLSFNNFLMQTVYGVDYIDEMVQEMRGMLLEVEHYLDGQVLLTFYIGENDRMLSAALDVDLLVMDERVWLNLSLDMGLSAMDTWRLDINGMQWGQYFTFYATWEIVDDGDTYINVITFNFGDGDMIIITSEWDPASGEFTFSHLEENYSWGWRTECAFSGLFTTDGETFRLWIEHADQWYATTTDWAAFDAVWDAFMDTLDDYEWWDAWNLFDWDAFDWDAHSTQHLSESWFSLEISTTAGAPRFRRVEFIGIDEWVRMLYEMFTA